MGLSGLLGACPVISILRGIRPEEAESIGFALIESGIRIAEVPLNSPEPVKSISILAENFGDQMLVGAGTVIAAEQVAQVASVGGKLVVTPHADMRIVSAAKEAGLIVIPGALSPTEVFAMHHAGADAIKLFPAEALGIEMLKALLVALPKHVQMIPVGGIDSRNASSWMAAGASGVGVGSSLYKPGDDASDVLGKARNLMSSLVNLQI
jgi:2-dehydro-3-deoxyphosphogalactonate aldolase